MSETPFVVVLAQRIELVPGLPTWTGSGDIYGSKGWTWVFPKDV